MQSISLYSCRAIEYDMAMEFAKWSENLAIDIDLIDDQHKVLINLINETSKMVLNRNDKKVGEILKELQEWTDKHFAEEEELFSRSSYPDVKKHKDEHGYFIDKLSEFQKEHTGNDLSVSLNILQFLKNWLFYHIEMIDKSYAPYVKKILAET